MVSETNKWSFKFQFRAVVASATQQWSVVFCKNAAATPRNKTHWSEVVDDTWQQTRQF